jgi:ribosomal protein S18 acetylase RimI-like enzyme
VSFPISLEVLKNQIEYSPENAFCLLENGRVRAFGQLIKKGGQRFHLARIIVAPDARRNGYGRKLTLCLISRADHLKGKMLTLNVYQSNIGALKLYRTIGFEPAPGPDGESLPAGVVHLRYPPPE